MPPPQECFTIDFSALTRILHPSPTGNVLNPHPYLFWFGVGAPTLIKAKTLNTAAPFLFILGFYTMLAGSKVLVSVLIGKSTTFLRSKVYIYIVRFLGLALCVLAFILVRAGLKLTGFM
jgi:threonine/homoserine/homoserine lactone efflux protein